MSFQRSKYKFKGLGGGGMREKENELRQMRGNQKGARKRQQVKSKLHVFSLRSQVKKG